MGVVDEILKTIDYALDKKLPTLKRDVTYICRVEGVGENNTYKLVSKGTYFNVILENIKLKQMDTVHLVIPNGDDTKKYVLEDVIAKVVKSLST